MKDVKLAPVVLFVYDRPETTAKTLNALLNNSLAAYTDIYIYSDASKNIESNDKVKNVRNYIHSIHGFKSITIIEREENWGLANNIIDGVTEICRRYGKAIVIEDDIVTSKYFLKYMNDALNIYEYDEKVMAISGFFNPGENSDLNDTFFMPWFNCWGWATWDRAWEKFERKPAKAIKEFSRKQIKHINYDGLEDIFGQVVSNYQGTLYTWAVFFFITIFKYDSLVLYCNKNMVMNIGMDGTGENCGYTDCYDRDLDNSPIVVEKIPLIADSNAEEIVKKFYSEINQKPPILVRAVRMIKRDGIVGIFDKTKEIILKRGNL